jgi:hypothetical protein
MNARVTILFSKIIVKQIVYKKTHFRFSLPRAWALKLRRNKPGSIGRQAFHGIDFVPDYGVD